MTTLPERLLAEAESYVSTYGETSVSKLLREAALALQPSVGGEVVGWGQFEDGKLVGFAFTRNEAGGCVSPLFASPAQPSDARDAARYRWLRDIKRVSEGVAEGGIYIGIESREIWALCEEAADAAIDAALTAAPSAPRAGDTAQDSGQGERLN